MAAESHASYRVPVTVNDDSTNLTPAQREAQSAALRAPGRVLLDGAGNVTIEQAREQRPAAPQVGDHVWHNGKECVVLADGDVMPVNAAKAAGVYPSSRPSQPQASGDKPSAGKSSESQQDEQPLGWQSDAVDLAMATVGREVGETRLSALVAHGIEGNTEISDAVARDIASSMDGVEPAEIQRTYAAAYEAGVDKANELVEQAGVNDLDSFYAHMERNHAGELREIRWSFAQGNAAPLVKAAKQYVASRGSGISAADETRLLDPRNQVNGGTLYRDDRGVTMVEIQGQRFTLKEAVRRGYVKVSEA